MIFVSTIDKTDCFTPCACVRGKNLKIYAGSDNKQQIQFALPSYIDVSYSIYRTVVIIIASDQRGPNKPIDYCFITR